MNIAEIKDYLIVAQLVGTFVLLLVMLYLKSAFVPRAEHKKFADDVGARLTSHSERLGNLDTRVLLVEREQKSMPSNESMLRLELALSDMRGELKVTNERLNGIEDLHGTLKHQVNVMDEFFRNQS